MPEPWIHIAWLSVGLFALLVMLGLFYRVAIVALTLVFSYFFLLDQAQYLNHFYLVILFLMLMCFLPANRRLSLDAKLWGREADTTVPYAAVFILRAQMEIMLVYAGLVKLTPDRLAGEPLGQWLRRQADDFPFGFLFHYDWVILAGAWGTIFIHVIGAPLLLWKKTRLYTFIVYCGFHTANSMFFNIGIFPWLAIAATTIFFAPDWPHRVARFVSGGLKILPGAGEPSHRAPVKPVSAFALVGMGVWLILQIALPARAWFIPTEVRWTGDGHRYSWRMRIYDRVAVGRFIVTADGQRWIVDPADHLSHRQARMMLVRPDMIYQFAHYLKADREKAGYTSIAVQADIWKSLNGRPMQRYIDPDVDLITAPFSPIGSNSWVLPLDIPVWGVLRPNRSSWRSHESPLAPATISSLTW